MAMEPTSQPPRRVLVVSEDPGAIEAYLACLRAHGEVQVVGSITAAVEALSGGTFDVVVASGPELLPLAQEVGREQRHRVLDGITQGVCVIDPAGQMLWSNATLRDYPPEVGEAIRQTCAQLVPELRADATPRARRRSVAVDDRYYFELSVAALTDGRGNLDRVVGLVSDTTAVTRMRERLDAIDAAGRELVALEGDVTARMELPERVARLEEKLIQYCQDLLHFTHFAVLVLEPKTGRLEPVLMGGFPEHTRQINIYARTEGNGISGYVAATGQAYICPDVSQDPLYLSGIEAARSSLTVPLRLIDRIVGVLNVEADQPGAFSEQDRQVAEIFGRYIAVALHTLKLLAVERSETTGQVAADVRSEIAAPLNDIVAEVTQLLQTEGAEVRQHRLRVILERVDAVKQTLQAVSTAPAIRGLAFETAGPNPLLQGRRVLVADDEDIIRETVAEVLSKAGALTVMARDGEQAIAMVRAQRFDLVLSDIKMPYRNGYEVFAAVKEVNDECHVILITGFGYDPEHSIVRASREGLAGVLFKPFKVEQLLELIQQAFAADG